MNQKAARFLTKNNIKPHDILYFLRDDRKTILHLTNDRTIDTYIPVKYILSSLPQGAFLNITKGVVISATEIRSISGNVYTMSNGVQFTGRHRGAGEHKTNRLILEHRVEPGNRLISETIAERFSVLDNHSLACCVIELVFNSAGHGVDFVFRYCNKAMSELEGYNLDELIDHSFYEIFRDGDHRWLAIYSDVALNGTHRIITDYKPETNKHVTVFCYQPIEGFCACTLVEGSLLP